MTQQCASHRHLASPDYLCWCPRPLDYFIPGGWGPLAIHNPEVPR